VFESNLISFSFLLAPSAPRSVLASNDSSTRLNITWDEPEKFNGVLTRYTVYYKLVRDDNDVEVTGKNWMSINVMTTQTSVTLRDLGEFYQNIFITKGLFIWRRVTQQG
jgi:hypothetical protein